MTSHEPEPDAVDTVDAPGADAAATPTEPRSHAAAIFDESLWAARYIRAGQYNGQPWNDTQIAGIIAAAIRRCV